jgi:MATE family multidrug resistance protein
MRKVTIFALPISAGALLNMIASFGSMMMVANLGQAPLAAGALAVSTFLTIMTVVGTIFYAVGILISHGRGQGKSAAEIGEIVKNGFWLAVLLMLPAALILWHADKILLLLKQDPQLVALTHGYFHYAALLMVPFLCGSVMVQFFAGTGNPKFTLMTSAISLPAILLLAYGFILGNFGLPQLGLAGVTCASFIVQSIVCMSILIYMCWGKKPRQYRIFSGNFLPDWPLCKTIFLLGLPIGIQFGAELAAIAASTYFMGYFGVTALAASQISGQYSLLVVMIILGLSQALSVLSSEAYGKNNMPLVKQYLIASIYILLIFFAIVFLFFLFMPKMLIHFYAGNLTDPVLIASAITFFAIAGITLLIDGVRNLFSGALRGLHDSKAPMHIGVICLWAVSLPASYLVGLTFNGGPVGLRIGFISGFLLAVLLLWARMRQKMHLITTERIELSKIPQT